MSIFKLHDSIIDDNGKYIQGYFSLANEKIGGM